MPDRVTLTNEQLRGIVHQAVEESLTRLGIDVSSPISVQEDFAFLRTMREGSKNVKKAAGTTLIGGILTFIGGLIYFGWWSTFHSEPPTPK